MYFDYYKSDTIRVISVLVTFFIAIPLLAVFFGATGYLVNTLTEGYVSRELGMWVVSTIVLFYVTRGGFKSIVSVGLGRDQIDPQPVPGVERVIGDPELVLDLSTGLGKANAFDALPWFRSGLSWNGLDSHASCFEY